jgi:hypothetical protein
MSIGSLGIVGSLAGTPSPQRASETERVERETVDKARESDAADRAESAAGIGEAEGDSQASERDADGRRLWEMPALPTDESPQDLALPASGSKDPTGQTGVNLDLLG